RDPQVADLPFSDGAHNDVDPYVTPDEALLIFSSDRGAPTEGGKPGPERLFAVFRPRSRAPLVCPLRLPGWEDPSVSMIEARLSRDRRTLYFASRRLAHGAGEPPRGDWDSGKANIWAAPFTAGLWRFGGASAACMAAG
ncbi:MAG TPA: hypothetical protein VFW13_06750, partial [Phenylobacterium sp.]|nr:hypothetical protein [Phenylobacterium sp.]